LIPNQIRPKGEKIGLNQSLECALKNLVILSCAVVLTACAAGPTRWVKEGAAPGDFDAASQQCKAKAESQIQTMQQQVVISYVNCLESLGWQPERR
jgi:hypothetical protein